MPYWEQNVGLRGVQRGPYLFMFYTVSQLLSNWNYRLSCCSKKMGVYFHTTDVIWVTLVFFLLHLSIRISCQSLNLGNQNNSHMSTQPAVVGGERGVVKTPVVQVVVSGVEVPGGIEVMFILKQWKSHTEMDDVSHGFTYPSIGLHILL